MRLRQFDTIQDQFHGTKYTVALKKSEESRLNTFSRKIAAELEASAAIKIQKQTIFCQLRSRMSLHRHGGSQEFRRVMPKRFLVQDRCRCGVFHNIERIPF